MISIVAMARPAPFTEEQKHNYTTHYTDKLRKQQQRIEKGSGVVRQPGKSGYRK